MCGGRGGKSPALGNLAIERRTSSFIFVEPFKKLFANLNKPSSLANFAANVPPHPRSPAPGMPRPRPRPRPRARSRSSSSSGSRTSTRSSTTCLESSVGTAVGAVSVEVLVMLCVEVLETEDVSVDDVFLFEDVAAGPSVEDVPLDDVFPCEDVDGSLVEDGREEAGLRVDVFDGSLVDDEEIVRLCDDVTVDPWSVFCVDVPVTEEDERGDEYVKLCDDCVETPVLFVYVEVQGSEVDEGDDEDVSVCDDIVEDPFLVVYVEVPLVVGRGEEGRRIEDVELQVDVPCDEDPLTVETEDVGMLENVEVPVYVTRDELRVTADDEDVSPGEDVGISVAVVRGEVEVITEDEEGKVKVELFEDVVLVKLDRLGWD